MGIFDDFFGRMFDLDGDGVTSFEEELIGLAFLETLDEEQEDDVDDLFEGGDFDD